MNPVAELPDGSVVRAGPRVWVKVLGSWYPAGPALADLFADDASLWAAYPGASVTGVGVKALGYRSAVGLAAWLADSVDSVVEVSISGSGDCQAVAPVVHTPCERAEGHAGPHSHTAGRFVWEDYEAIS